MGKEKTEKEMTYNTHTLPNGLRIIHLPSASPVVYCGYGVAAGTRHELEGEEGLAHFCEHATFKGTSRRSALRVINTLEGVGGELNAFTNKESTVYYAAVLRDHFPRAVDLLTDIVFCSTYPQAELDREVEVVCDEIESYNDSPAELIYDEFENLIFSGHPLGHGILGSSDRLRTYRREDVAGFARRHYRPDNAVFFVYGDIDFRRLTTLLSRLTTSLTASLPASGITGRLLSERANRPLSNNSSDSGMSGGPLSEDSPTVGTYSCICPQAKHPSPALPPYIAREVILHKETHQAHVMTGCRTFGAGDDRRMALYLLNNILGGPGMNARLNVSLRERHGLVYTVESTMVTYSDTGLWSVYFGCDPHDITRCRRLVRRELDRMMDRPLTATALATAKRQLKGQLAVACDNRESFALDFGRTFLHYGHGRDINTLFNRIDAVTADRIQAVAQELFAPDRLTTLIFE